MSTADVSKNCAPSPATSPGANIVAITTYAEYAYAADVPNATSRSMFADPCRNAFHART